MKLSKKELIEKFKNLEKFKDEKWFCDEAIKLDCNYKELPLKAAKQLIEDTILFLEETKFKNHWESNFSIKIRLTQVGDLLNFFCEKTEEEKTLKGTNLHQ